MIKHFSALCAGVALMAFSGAAESAVPAPPIAGSGPEPAYADLADLADRAPVVVRAQVRKIAVVEPARAPGLRPGWARLYIEARTQALLAGPALAGDSLRYLADVPLDVRGKPPKLAKRMVLVFARPVPGAVSGPVPGRGRELQLVAPDAQILWSAGIESRLRGVLGELLATGAPGRITGVQEAIFVPGNLAGEGETQMFLATADGEPASITVVHSPGRPPRWSVSFSEVVDADGEPPARETLPWYRLACFLPAALDGRVNVSATDNDRAQARTDYAFVMDSLGPCSRLRE